MNELKVKVKQVKNGWILEHGFVQEVFTDGTKLTERLSVLVREITEQKGKGL